VDWTHGAPANVQTELLAGTITVLAGQSETVDWPCFDVSYGATPGEYAFDILWTGTNSNGDDVLSTTDPSIILGSSGGGGGINGGVGGIVEPVNKLDLLYDIFFGSSD